MKRWVLALVLTASSAWAQDVEQATVEKNRGLSGLWRIQVPRSVGVNFFRDAKFGPMRDIFCRIEDNLIIHCLNGGFSRDGAVTQDGNSVHIAWGSMMARFAIDGQLAGNSITGTFVFKLSGLPHEAPATSNSTRFTGTIAPQAGGNAPALAAYLNSGNLPSTLDGLDAMDQIMYLGNSPQLDGSGAADYFSVYAIEFSGGERICGVHQRSDGTFDAFECV